nr:G protein-coupled receptor [Proales similis]
MAEPSSESPIEYWKSFAPVGNRWFHLSAFLYGTVFVLGLSANLLVLFYLVKTRRFQNHSSYFIVNLVVADIFKVLINAPMNVASSLAGRWLFGQLGCDVYGVAGGLFGFLNIATMLCMSIERFLVVRDPLIVLKMKSKYVLGSIALCWVYAAASIAPQLLSPNRFVLEGFLTSCSFDYISQDLTTRVYMLAMFTTGFLIPFICILFFNISLFWRLRERNFIRNLYTRNIDKVPEISQYLSNIAQEPADIETSIEMEQLTRPVNAKRRLIDRGESKDESIRTVTSESLFENFLQREIKVAKSIAMVVVMFCFAWLPYALVALLAQFSSDRQLYVNPYTSAMPAIFAKFSSIYNPIVLTLSGKECRRFYRRWITQFCHARLHKRDPLVIYS